MGGEACEKKECYVNVWLDNIDDGRRKCRKRVMWWNRVMLKKQWKETGDVVVSVSVKYFR